MALKDRFNGSERRARAEMESAAKQKNDAAEFQDKLLLRTGDEKFAKTYRLRGRLYDKIHLSVRTMDIVIYATVILIVAALVIGILTGNR